MERRCSTPNVASARWCPGGGLKAPHSMPLPAGRFDDRMPVWPETRLDSGDVPSDRRSGVAYAIWFHSRAPAARQPNQRKWR